jgi:hypothetical protein
MTKIFANNRYKSANVANHFDESTDISNILKFCNCNDMSTYVTVESVEGDKPFSKILPDYKTSSSNVSRGH